MTVTCTEASNTPYVYYLNTAYYRNTCSLQYPGAYFLSNSYRQTTEKYIIVAIENIARVIRKSAKPAIFSSSKRPTAKPKDHKFYIKRPHFRSLYTSLIPSQGKIQVLRCDFPFSRAPYSLLQLPIAAHVYYGV